MQVIQPFFDISDAAAAGLAAGTLVRTGGVIRDAATKQIFEHLKDAAPNNATSSSQAVINTAKTANVAKASTSVAIKESTSLSLGRKFAVGTLIVVGVVAIGYGSYRLFTYLKKRSDEKRQKELIKQNNEVIAYNPELTEYFNHMQTQSMTLSSIKKVVDFFEKYSDSDLSIEITYEEMMVIRNLIVRYTIKLCEANHISLEGKQLSFEAKPQNKDDLLREILYATQVQEKIFNQE
jgi:uncharacterized membrane-anchored protein YhcB (DUF1043 family)